MPDRETVIKGLEPIIGCAKQEKWGAWIDTLEDAITLLKEQEAVEPIPFFTETGEESKNYVVCGHCKSINSIMPKATKQKYCHECGHPVLWKGR